MGKRDKTASVHKLVDRIKDLADIGNADDSMTRLEETVIDIESRVAKCRQCGVRFIRKRYREEQDGFCTDPHRAQWHRNHPQTKRRRKRGRRAAA